MEQTRDKVIKCQAAVIWGKDQPLQIEEIEVDPPQKGEIRVKVLHCSLCQSDMIAIKKKFEKIIYPGIIGHEAAGIIESVGEGVVSLKVGDKVLPCFNPQCNSCVFCESPDTNFCITIDMTMGFLPDGTSRYRCRGEKLSSFARIGGFSQYIVLSENGCAKVDDDAALEQVCLLSCGIPTGYGAALNTAKVTPGSTCAIWGLGTIGLAVAMGCKANGASRIIGIDMNSDKEEKCKTFGVTDFINPKNHVDPIHVVLQKMTGLGCDFTFECIGLPSTVKSALQSCRIGTGKCVVVGVCPEKDPLVLDPMDFLLAKTITGCLFGGYKPKDAIPSLFKAYKEKKILLEEFISGRLPLKDVNEAIQLLVDGKALRTVVDMF